jgi:hypothetical protein
MGTSPAVLRLQGMHLLHSLVLLSAGSAVPILGFALLAAGFVVQGESENLVSAAKARNRATLAAVDAELRGAIGTLHAIGSTPSLVARDFEEFDRYARTMLANQPSWQDVVLSDRDGRQVVNARLPWGTSLPQQAVEILRRCGHETPADRRRLDVRTAPRRRAGHSRACAGRPRPGGHARAYCRIERNLLPTAAGDAGTAKRVGGRHRRQERPPDCARAAHRTGQPASDDYLRHARTVPEGWYRGNTLEGKDTFTAYSTSPLTGWSIG